MRHLFLFIAIVCSAQTSRAFVVSDTLIIDGEIIYVEEQDAPINDSLGDSRSRDFKKKRNFPFWGIDAGYMLQSETFSITNNSSSDLMSLNDFLGEKNTLNYQNGILAGGYLRLHKNIEVGIGFQQSNGNVVERTAILHHSDEFSSFFALDHQIYHVYSTEVQPDVLELDTVKVAIATMNFNFKTVQIPLKLRFYINDFGVKSRWRAFAEISPVYRSFKLTNSSSSSNAQMLFLNAQGNYTYLEVTNQHWKNFGVTAGVGSEFRISNKVTTFVQANWSFSPTNYVTTNGLKFSNQYSNLMLGIRVGLSKGK